MFNYQKQIEVLVNYFKSGEKADSNLKLGLEIEHLVLEEETLKAISYYGDQGIEGILKKLAGPDFRPIYQDEYILGLKGEKATVSLEPGGQLELSIFPCRDIKSVERIYKSFLNNILPILNQENKSLYAIGYQPVSLIEDIPLLPKKRYKFMYEYFNTRGKYAHNMMKGTAATQVNLDYQNEEDFRKKMRVSYYLAPLLYTVFDNAPFFEGKVCYNNTRSIIWDNCDQDRCGLIDGVFTDNFGYADYASYLLNRPALLIKDDHKLQFVGDKLVRGNFNPDDYHQDEIEHIISMVFPDVRLKQYIEIRVGDSLPLPYSLSYLAFWQGLLYSPANLDLLYQETKGITQKDILEIKDEIEEKGVKASFAGRPVLAKFKDLLLMADQGLDTKNSLYLSKLNTMIDQGVTPKQITLHNLDQGLKKALSWCKIRTVK